MQGNVVKVIQVTLTRATHFNLLKRYLPVPRLATAVQSNDS